VFDKIKILTLRCYKFILELIVQYGSKGLPTIGTGCGKDVLPFVLVGDMAD
jgi:hypothetical protein